ncbi:LacI family DNA-binding transcriptional regulator [Aliamphritea hakodatensis]|uniref:LacI family DNA-binding transcriptional regulator n=1 Tax=Aliamphritea hakodatensis TaxID=2895352 RepID=UPI0022FD3B06|nr:LacI family DNA-binding transcriptional regulator [Aliamphritea hakodatensis]
MGEAKKKKLVKLDDVAQLAGVSQMTVSKVLRGTGRISEKTRTRVHAAADELGYVKNFLAGSLRSQTSSFVGVIIPSASNAIFAEILSGINEQLRPHGLNTLIGESLFDGKIEEELIKTMLSIQPAGLIICGGLKHTESSIKLLNLRHCPSVQLWSPDKGFGDTNIGPSHIEAGKLMARHFLKRGFNHIGYVGAELEKDLCAEIRHSAFTDTLQKAGKTIVEAIDPNMSRQAESGRELTRQLITQHPKTDAIFYLNDAMAIGGITWLYEQGISVPEQVAVAGFNGTSVRHSIRTQITTIDVPRHEIGTAAGNAIINLAAGKETPGAILSPISFIQGNTT